MSEKLTLSLHNRAQAWAVINSQLFPFLKTVLQGGGQWVLTVARRKRTNAQNALLHATLAQISARAEWAGKKWDVDVWKRLMTAAWLRANGSPVVVLPALDGAGVDVVITHTSKLNTAQCADLIEYMYAWSAENDIILDIGDFGGCVDA